MDATLRIGELREAIGFSARTIQQWVDAGKIKASRIPGGKERRVKIEDALEFARSEGLPIDKLELLARERGVGPRKASSILLVSLDQGIIRLLAESGRDLTVAESGVHAGRLIERRRFDLVIVDLAEIGRHEADQLAAQAKRDFPETRTAVILGEDDMGEHDGFDLARKRPCDPNVLCDEALSSRSCPKKSQCENSASKK